MAGTRKYNDPVETTVKLTVAVPVDLDRQLRALSARLGMGVGPLVRMWITAKLDDIYTESFLDDVDAAVAAGASEPT
jgi:hypothetical protein